MPSQNTKWSTKFLSLLSRVIGALSGLSWADDIMNADKVFQRDICGRDQRDVVCWDLRVFRCDLRTCRSSRCSGDRRLVRRGTAANQCRTSCSPARSTSTIRHHDGTQSLISDHWQWRRQRGGDNSECLPVRSEEKFQGRPRPYVISKLSCFVICILYNKWMHDEWMFDFCFKKNHRI